MAIQTLFKESCLPLPNSPSPSTMAIDYKTCQVIRNSCLDILCCLKNNWENTESLFSKFSRDSRNIFEERIAVLSRT